MSSWYEFYDMSILIHKLKDHMVVPGAFQRLAGFIRSRKHENALLHQLNPQRPFRGSARFLYVEVCHTSRQLCSN